MDGHRFSASVTGVADRFPETLTPTEKLAVPCAPHATEGYVGLPRPETRPVDIHFVKLTRS